MVNKRSFEVIGASFELGCGEAGTATAPSFFRQLGLIDRLRQVAPNLADGQDIAFSGGLDPGPDPKLKYLDQVLAYCRDLYTAIGEVYVRDRLPLLIGGDHSISIASLAAAANMLRHKGIGNGDLGVLWVDAHTDANTPATTPSGNIHGMALAVAMGYGHEKLTSFLPFRPILKPENLVYVGVRDLDPGERDFIKQHQITAYSMREIDILGIGEVCRRAYDQLERQTAGVVVSFDLDVCDPALAPGVGTPVRGGLTFREAHLIMEYVYTFSNLLSVEMVEFNPTLDRSGLTSEIGIHLLESALGKTIL